MCAWKKTDQRGIRKLLSAFPISMELRVYEGLSEPSHIHIPRPSRAARGSVQVQTCPANVCAEMLDRLKDYPTFAERD